MTNFGEGMAPRQWAALILSEPDKSKWAAIANQAPIEWLGLIREHVQNGLRARR